MKIHQILFLLFFIYNAFSMEQKKNYALKKINHSVNFPKYIACLQNNHVVIAGTGGVDVIDMNTKTKESISQLYNLKKDPLEITHDIATNKEKSQVAIISTLYLRHYNIENNKITLLNQLDNKKKYIAFTYDDNLIVHNPHQEIIYLNGIPTPLQDYTYIKNLEKPIICHPSKNLILYPSSHSQYNSLVVDQCICYATNFLINVSNP